MNHLDLKDRVVVVTGAAGGLGRSLCRAYAKRGAKIGALDLETPALEALDQALTEEGIAHVTAACNVCDDAQVKAAIDKVIETFGRVDVVVNNAGITHLSLANETTIDTVQRIMDVNLFGCVRITQAAMPELLKNQGQVVTISSVAGLTPLYGRCAYSASKHATHGYFESLRSELVAKETGVSVTMICPSVIDTGIRENAKSAAAETGEKGTDATQNHIGGENQSPDDVAEQIVKATEQRLYRRLIGGIAKKAVIAKTLAPAFYERVMVKNTIGQVEG